MKAFGMLLLSGVVCFAAGNGTAEKSSSPDPKIASQAHEPMFRAPESQQAGVVTERVTAGLDAVSTAPVPHRNFIDEHVFGKMERDGVPHAPLASDREFLRRVRLDLTGRLPSPSEIREFLADDSADKRPRLIARLVGSPEWVDKWAYQFMDTLRANGKMKAYQLFHYMLRQSLAADRPYDDLVSSLITSSAKSNVVVASVNQIVREHVEGKPGQVEHGDDLAKIHQNDTHDELTIQFGKVFLGINLSCISCHDGAEHLEKVNVYLSTRARTDFFQQAAFLGRTRYIPHVENTEAIMGHSITDDLGPGYDSEGTSILRMQRLGGPESPKFLLTDEEPNAEADPRDELARMLTSNPQFARATVNMFWAKLMGFGIVEPFDEFDLARQDPKNLPEGWDAQPSNPELLTALAEYFRENDYSLHKLFTAICNSSAYQLSARFPGEWSDNYTKYYARKFARMLSAEELHDAIATATGRPGNFKDGSETVPMAMQVSLPKPRGELKTFMQAFGQANRTGPQPPMVPSPLQPIMMMRSPVVNDRVLAEKDSLVQRLLDSYSDDRRVVEELFLATIARDPSEEEMAVSIEALSKDRREGAQNLQWALLNLVEFLYNL
jgi:hypothetical protein